MPIDVFFEAFFFCRNAYDYIESPKTALFPEVTRQCRLPQRQVEAIRAGKKNFRKRVLLATLLIMSASGSVGGSVKRKNLTSSQKRAAIAELLKGSNNGKLCRGDLKRVGEQFEQHPETISRLWKSFNQQKEDGVVDPNLDNRRKVNSGRKGIDLVAVRSALKEIPIKSRTTIRGVAAALGVPKMTLFDNLKKLGLRATSRFLKPLLTDDNKKARLEWALRWVSSGPGHGHKIHHFEDFVHIAVLLLYCCCTAATWYE